jgi:hypothetical protein
MTPPHTPPSSTPAGMQACAGQWLSHVASVCRPTEVRLLMPMSRSARPRRLPAGDHGPGGDLLGQRSVQEYERALPWFLKKREVQVGLKQERLTVLGLHHPSEEGCNEG